MDRELEAKEADWVNWVQGLGHFGIALTNAPLRWRVSDNPMSGQAASGSEAASGSRCDLKSYRQLP